MVSNQVIVVGGGAAGLIAAARAAEVGASVCLLEKNDRIGLKILISGGGKCNLTHDGSMEDIRASFRRNEALFLKPSFYKFTSNDFLDILHRAGLQTYSRPDGRIFPVEPANARDVVSVLDRHVRNSGVHIKTRFAVESLELNGGHVVGVRANGQFLAADHVVVAVGGSSYPATGTTGDGWHWLSAIGHQIVPLRAALAPLYLANARPDWSGIGLYDILLRARLAPGGKEYAKWRGDLLFTHKGVSGPCALGISREVAERIAAGVPGGGVIEVDLAPDLSFEEIQADIRAEMTANPRKTVGSIVDRYLPARLAEPFLKSVDVFGEVRGAHFPAKSLNRFVNGLKGWTLGAVRSVPLERGEVVAGGVSLDEVNSRTMMSKIARGLSLCGEVLDLAGPVGGYNLQAAWSTGYVAGEHAAAAMSNNR